MSWAGFGFVEVSAAVAIDQFSCLITSSSGTEYKENHGDLRENTVAFYGYHRIQNNSSDDLSKMLKIVVNGGDEQEVAVLSDANLWKIHNFIQNSLKEVYGDSFPTPFDAVDFSSESVLANPALKVLFSKLADYGGPKITFHSELPAVRLASGKPVADTGKPGTDTGKPVADTGKPVADTGKPVADTGKPGAGTGKPVADTGKPGTDTGKPGTDTGKPGTDTGKPGTDTGKPGTDTGKPGTDTGKPGADTGKPGADTEKPGADTEKPDTGLPSWLKLGFFWLVVLANCVGLGLMGRKVALLDREVDLLDSITLDFGSDEDDQSFSKSYSQLSEKYSPYTNSCSGWLVWLFREVATVDSDIGKINTRLSSLSDKALSAEALKKQISQGLKDRFSPDSDTFKGLVEEVSAKVVKEIGTKIPSKDTAGGDQGDFADQERAAENDDNTTTVQVNVPELRPEERVGELFVAFCKDTGPDSVGFEDFRDFLRSTDSDEVFELTTVYSQSSSHELEFLDNQRGPNIEFWRVVHRGESYLLPKPTSDKRFMDKSGFDVGNWKIQPRALLSCLPASLDRKEDRWVISRKGALSDNESLKELSARMEREFGGSTEASAGSISTKLVSLVQKAFLDSVERVGDRDFSFVEHFDQEVTNGLEGLSSSTKHKIWLLELVESNRSSKEVAFSAEELSRGELSRAERGEWELMAVSFDLSGEPDQMIGVPFVRRRGEDIVLAPCAEVGVFTVPSSLVKVDLNDYAVISLKPIELRRGGEIDGSRVFYVVAKEGFVKTVEKERW